MERRGEVEPLKLIIGIVLGLLVLGLMIVILYKVSATFRDSITCPDDGDTYTKRHIIDGCQEDEKRALGKFWGYDVFKEVCCVKKSSSDLTGGSRTSREDTLSITAHVPAEDVEIADGQTVSILAARAKQVIFQIELGNCDDCAASNISIRMDAPTGVSILDDVAVGKDGVVESGKWKHPNIVNGVFVDSSWDVKGGKKKKTIDLNFSFDSDFIKEIFTFRLKVQIFNSSSGSRETLEEKTFTVFFNVRPAVRYGGLNQQWTQKKLVTAICEDPVECDWIYYEIISNKSSEPPECIPPVPGKISEPKLLSEVTQYCILDARHPEEPRKCYDKQSECLAAISTVFDPTYGSSFDAFLDALGLGNIPLNVGVLFQKEESNLNTLSCHPNLMIDDGISTSSKRILFKSETFSKDTQRGTFPLEMPFMSEKYLCVYGKDVHDGQYYTADKGQEIRIDTVPPIARIKFSQFGSFGSSDPNSPGILELRFECEDEQSGCRDGYYGLSYIDKASNFLPALFSKQPQNAIIWCPPWTNGANYRPESRNVIPYRDSAIRVLCLRVEDNAGNAGVTMTTVYNSFQLLAGALAAYYYYEEDPRYDRYSQYGTHDYSSYANYDQYFNSHYR